MVAIRHFARIAEAKGQVMRTVARGWGFPESQQQVLLSGPLDVMHFADDAALGAHVPSVAEVGLFLPIFDEVRLSAVGALSWPFVDRLLLAASAVLLPKIVVALAHRSAAVL